MYNLQRRKTHVLQFEHVWVSQISSYFFFLKFTRICEPNTEQKEICFSSDLVSKHCRMHGTRLPTCLGKSSQALNYTIRLHCTLVCVVSSRHRLCKLTWDGHGKENGNTYVAIKSAWGKNKMLEMVNSFFWMRTIARTLNLSCVRA